MRWNCQTVEGLALRRELELGGWLGLPVKYCAVYCRVTRSKGPVEFVSGIDRIRPAIVPNQAWSLGHSFSSPDANADPCEKFT